MGEAELSPDIERLVKKWEKDPSSRVFAQLGDLYRKAKLYDEAIQVLTKGIEMNPNYAPGHLILAKTYLDQMRSAMAKEELDKVLSIDPQNVVALRLLAPIVEKGGTDQELTRIYELILSMDPGDQTTFEKLDQLKKRQPQKKEEVPTGSEFQVETFQQFRPPEDKGEPISEVKSDLVDQMVVEPLQKKPTFVSDLPEEKVEVEPYVEKPGGDIKSTEEIIEEEIDIEPYVERPGADIKPTETEEAVEEELQIERDISFQSTTEEPVAEEKIDTSIMGQLTDGKEVGGEEVVDEEIDLQSDLMSQMGAGIEKGVEIEGEKIDTDIMGQLTEEPTTKTEPQEEIKEKQIVEPEPAQIKTPESITAKEQPSTTVESREKVEEISSIEDVLEGKSSDEEVPTVDEILKPEETKEPKEEKQEDEDKGKESIQSFRDWLDGLTK